MFALTNSRSRLARMIAVMAIIAYAAAFVMAASSQAAPTAMADGCHHHAEQTTPAADDCHQEHQPQPADNCLGDCLSACLAMASVAMVDQLALTHIDLYLLDAYFGAVASHLHARQPEFATPPPRA